MFNAARRSHTACRERPETAPRRRSIFPQSLSGSFDPPGRRWAALLIGQQGGHGFGLNDQAEAKLTVPPVALQQPADPGGVVLRRFRGCRSSRHRGSTRRCAGKYCPRLITAGEETPPRSVERSGYLSLVIMKGLLGQPFRRLTAMGLLPVATGRTQAKAAAQQRLRNQGRVSICISSEFNQACAQYTPRGIRRQR